MVLAPGANVGDFVVERLLGWGGMGVVYLARQPGLDRVVALKVIDPSREEDEGLRMRFERETRIAASIDHPHVLPIYEAGEAEGVLYLAMRFVDGSDLRTVLAREGKLDLERAARITRQVAGALDAAHARGLVHRDVKPANVLLTTGDPEHAYLTDFGVAKRTATATDLTRAGALIGSVDYVPPEQIQGRDLGPARRRLCPRRDALPHAHGASAALGRLRRRPCCRRISTRTRRRSPPSGPTCREASTI